MKKLSEVVDMLHSYALTFGEPHNLTLRASTALVPGRERLKAKFRTSHK